MIYIGAGIIPQIERFASKSVYYKFTIQTLNTAIAALNRKAEKPQGNHLKIVGEAAWECCKNNLFKLLENHWEYKTTIY